MSEATDDRDPPSFRDVSPDEYGGRVAQGGFLYQSHIGASFCLDMLEENGLAEIWFEWHDDIVLVWEKEGNEHFELVQVKNEDLGSRYSVSKITRQGDGGPGSSLVERSLNRSKGSEPSSFRIVTSYGVNSVLSVLETSPDSQERDEARDDIESLKRALSDRLDGEPEANDGTTLSDWVDRCYWDKRAETIESLAPRNEKRLGQLLSKRGLMLYPDQVTEIYTSLVSRIGDLSRENEEQKYKLNRQQCEDWLRDKAQSRRNSGKGNRTLQRKLEAANVSGKYDDAADYKRAYLSRRLNKGYANPTDYQDASNAITARLSVMQSEMILEVRDEGEPFHAECITQLDQMVDQNPLVSTTFDIVEAQGCMYYATNKCAHRFTREELGGEV